MSNLLEETKNSLAENGKSVEDVVWVGSRDGRFAMSWEEFALVANVQYDSGFGGNEIARELVVVGDGWWLERGEYDGSEWWEFKIPPVRLASAQKFSNVKNVDYDDKLTA